MAGRQRLERLVWRLKTTDVEKSPKANSHTWFGHVFYCHLPPLSDTLRRLALFYGSSRPTRANTEHNWEGRSLGRIHFILDAGATPPRPRCLLPARCIKKRSSREWMSPPRFQGFRGSEATSLHVDSTLSDAPYLPSFSYLAIQDKLLLSQAWVCRSSFFAWIWLSARFFSIKYH